MTAEIAVMNKQAVALAADSAVTYERGVDMKIFSSANKIFSLSKYQPVGIMVFGRASFMGIPWETTIKLYRQKLGKTEYDKLSDYADDFISFLGTETHLLGESEQEKYVGSFVYSYFNVIYGDIEKTIRTTITEEGKIEDSKISEIANSVVNKSYNFWKEQKAISSTPPNFSESLKERYGAIFKKIISEVFEKLPIITSHSMELEEIAASLFAKTPADWLDSGVVIAGFGRNDIFPLLKSYKVGGIANNVLIYRNHLDGEISYENDATILPFAIFDMVATFMNGIDPKYKKRIINEISRTLVRHSRMVEELVGELGEKGREDIRDRLKEISKEQLKTCIQKLAEYERDKHVSPVIRVVSMLPKNELAVMAETLVNLTSFKLKVSMEAEIAGGPIDVAVISKGDGLVWIKRKHYFEPESNAQFFANYYRSSNHER